MWFYNFTSRIYGYNTYTICTVVTICTKVANEKGVTMYSACLAGSMECAKMPKSMIYQVDMFFALVSFARIPPFLGSFAGAVLHRDYTSPVFTFPHEAYGNSNSNELQLISLAITRRKH